MYCTTLDPSPRFTWLILFITLPFLTCLYCPHYSSRSPHCTHRFQFLRPQFDSPSHRFAGSGSRLVLPCDLHVRYSTLPVYHTPHGWLHHRTHTHAHLHHTHTHTHGYFIHYAPHTFYHHYITAFYGFVITHTLPHTAVLFGSLPACTPLVPFPFYTTFTFDGDGVILPPPTVHLLRTLLHLPPRLLGYTTFLFTTHTHWFSSDHGYHRWDYYGSTFPTVTHTHTHFLLFTLFTTTHHSGIPFCGSYCRCYLPTFILLPTAHHTFTYVLYTHTTGLVLYGSHTTIPLPDRFAFGYLPAFPTHTHIPRFPGSPSPCP